MKVISRVKLYIEQTTMYRTVLYALVALTVWSWIGGMFGTIDLFPVAMAIQLLIAVGVGYCVDRLLAWAYKVKPNPESIFITAFILYFLITPDGSIKNFVLIAVAAAVAAVSKYLVVWRGKHVFNPAAFGAVFIGVSTLGFASWWVATPWLFPHIIALGALVVYKSRQVSLVLTYSFVSLLFIGITALANGVPLGGLIQTATISYPIIFLACFMLTEPQTLAPKKKQQIGIAIAVATLAYGHSLIAAPIPINPETALLVGNAISASLVIQRSTKLTLLGRRKLPGDQVEYVFSSERKIDFTAGQYAELHVSHVGPDKRGVRRMFTVASRPGSDEVKFITRHTLPSSTFKKALMNLAVGMNVKVTGVWGDFTLPEGKNKKVLMIAGGVGVTPFLSQLEWLEYTGQVRDVVFIYAVTNKKDAVDVSHSKKIARTVVHEGPLKQDDIAKYVKDIAKRQVYISGPPAMVSQSSADVRRLGATNIHKDFFAGY